MGYQGSGWGCSDGPTSPEEHKGEGVDYTEHLPVDVGQTAHVVTPVEMGNESGGEWEQVN